MYYVTHTCVTKEVQSFYECICPKVILIARLEFELVQREAPVLNLLGVWY